MWFILLLQLAAPTGLRVDSITAPLISNVIASNGKPYELVQGLDNGSSPYIDRTYTYTNVPPSLVGKTYIKTANSDKRIQVFSLTIDLLRPATVHIAHDNRYTLKPDWLSDFINAGEDVTVASVTHSLFSKSFQPGTITLGSNVNPLEPENNGMYIVIVEEQ